MPSSPAVSTVAASSAECVNCVPTRTSTRPVTTSVTCPSRPMRANGISIHLSHLMSRSWKTKSRNSINRNIPPNAAICGWAAMTSFS